MADSQDDIKQGTEVQPTDSEGVNSSEAPGRSGSNNDPETEEPKEKKTKPRKHHWIRPAWIRIPLKTIMWIIIGVLCIPVLIYVPPVQTFIKNIACKEVEKATGMKISIDRFRLKWPLDLSLQGVTVIEATGDTMVYAKEVIADVKMRPLLNLDVDVNKLSLLDAGFNMVAPDSSMTLKIKAGELVVDDKTSVDIKTLDINLNKVYLKDGNLSLVMDVWKAAETPKDTTNSTTPLTIRMGEVQLDNFGFEMAMLPTIDTLVFKSGSVTLRNGLVDLTNNKVTAGYLSASDGDLTFLTPTPEYIKTHPAPVDTVPSNSPPMVIQGDTVSISGFKALYGVVGAKPQPGFDPSYIEVSGVAVSLDGFLNEGSSITLPITRLEARERCGLAILSGSGTVALDSLGIKVEDVNIRTMYSEIRANADVPFSLMEMKPSAPVDILVSGSIGFPDVESFMPALKTYTSFIPKRTPLAFNIRAGGTLNNISLNRLDVGMTGIFSLKAGGNIANVFDFKKLDAALTFDGSLTNPGVVDKFIGSKEFKLPSLSIKGTASVRNQTYAADFKLNTKLGKLAADGKVSLNAETYQANVSIRDLNVGNFMPELGIGLVSADISAKGAGFNPEKPGAQTDISVSIPTIYYNKVELNNITAEVGLKDGRLSLSLYSPNDIARLNLTVEGTIAPDLYSIDLDATLGNLDMQALGLSKENAGGSGSIILSGTASPGKWLYDINLNLKDLSLSTGTDMFEFPGPLEFKFKSTPEDVSACLYAKETDLDFYSGRNLQSLIKSFEIVGDSVTRQIARRDLNVEWLQHALPPFDLNLAASGTGLLGDFLGSMGMSVDTLYARFTNDSIISGHVGVLELANASMRADTLSLTLKQRGTLLDYKAHMGNEANNPIADFANVNINGYVGSNRLMAGLWQKNQSGETGYRLGLTAAFVDSIVTVHFTPLKATIGYIPWTFNDDNFIDVNLKNFRVNADLMAQSPKSSILIKTQQGANGNDELHLALDNIQVQDFLNLSVFAPPITASVNMDLNIGYQNNWLYGTGSLGIEDFTYDKRRVGNFDLGFRAGLNDDGKSGARLSLKVNGHDALAAKAALEPDSAGRPQVKTLGLELTRFPVDIANAFLGPDIAKLSGYLNGDFNLTGNFSAPKLNGFLACDSLNVFIPMMGSSIKFNADSITVRDNVVAFNDFDIWGANKNPISINGTVDASHISSIMLDLNMNAQNFQLINNDAKAHSDLYGKLFFDLNASAKGPMQHFNINANLNVLSATNVTYSIPMTAAQLSQHDATGIVRFVNFNDTTQQVKADSVQSAIGMRIIAGLVLQPGMQANVIYPGTATTGTAKVEISPSGSLNYFQNYMGDMRLNGQVYLGNGFARYSMPLVGEKKFVFDPESYVQFTGDIMNPSFNISATDDVKASVIENNNSHIVNFLVEVDITNNLNDPKITFNLNTDDDLTIKNELMSMSPDQRSMAALNMLLTGQYTGNNSKTAGTDLLQGTMYNILTSQINGWLANNVRGVDINLGVDQYDNMVNGESGSATSYSYSVSKSLFNNKFKISVGGNYTTDASADENFSENLINDISFEYILKQTANVTMYARLFRHTGYESILEGEITETGVGFLLRRRLSNLKDLFKWGSGSLPAGGPLPPMTHKPDTTTTTGSPKVLPASTPADATPAKGHTRSQKATKKNNTKDKQQNK